MISSIKQEIIKICTGDNLTRTVPLYKSKNSGILGHIIIVIIHLHIYPFLIGSKKIRNSSPFNIHTVCVLWMQVKLIDETNLRVILAFQPNEYSAIYFIFGDDLLN